jgi:hypothetical protein
MDDRKGEADYDHIKAQAHSTERYGEDVVVVAKWILGEGLKAAVTGFPARS